MVFFYFDLNRMDRALNEDEILQITEQLLTTWPEAVSRHLTAAFGEREGRRLLQRWVTRETRSGLYREATPPHEVPFDVKHLDALEGRLEVAVVPRSPEHATLKVYALKPLGFIEILTTLGNLGLKVTGELHIPIQLPDGQTAHLYRYEIEDDAKDIQALIEGCDRVTDALRALDEERASDGTLNILVLRAELNWRQVEVLRTYRNHLQQIRPHYNVETVNGVLLRNADVARALFHVFEACFDPQIEGGRSKGTERAEAELQTALDAVRSLVEDEVLRALGSLISATVRTNFYQSPERLVVSIKVDSHKVEGMPSPKPMYEIYVHSRRLEGIHLRGGRIARGGIRWSDRHDDFRTEVLGLMKTQMVKNSIIVPVGSKGGFVLKGSLPPRPGLDGYLAERYREFISGLLDVTDNVVDSEMCHPPEVVRHDDDDPYLVVAADKGTAHLSDTANAVAKHYGFWLGDAFASGGSIGYDHKKVAITARGVWECIKHHFANLGVDVNKDSFTTAAIGDMAGDVFGNGMLLSRTMKLVAAFNHMHIFIDPNPDPDRSHAERERLFRLPRSSWRDYDSSLISPGGGVFDRSDKSIPASPEMKSLLGISHDRMSGEQMIRKILTSRVDLLYNGGIGTYVKASSEDNISVGDRTNDRLRVDGCDIRARVVGEGGNLGFTQKARLEYWTKGGGLINTDAVDNSGGVDLSDHEVNIKILMDMLVKKGVIENRAERDRLFLEMTEDVARLVLIDNARQALTLTLDGIRSAARYEDFTALIEELVTAGILNRQDDAVPRRRHLLDSAQRHRGLPRPLLALVLGHVKIWAYRQIVETDFPDTPEGAPFLEGYFPAPLREAFAEHFTEHPLRREIISTAAVNHLVNRAGVDFLSRMTRQTGAEIGDVLKAYMNVSLQSKAQETRQGILDATMDATRAYAALLQLEDIVEQATRAALEGQNPAPVVQELQKKLSL